MQLLEPGAVTIATITRCSRVEIAVRWLRVPTSQHRRPAVRVAAQRAVARPVRVRPVCGRGGSAQRIRLHPFQRRPRKHHQGQVEELFHTALKYRCPALLGDHLRTEGSVSGERRGAYPAGPRVSECSRRWRVPAPVAGLLRPAQCGGAGQQPVGGRVRIRASRHPRAGQDAHARHHGDTIMQAMAVGRIRAGQREHLRSLVRPA